MRKKNISTSSLVLLLIPDRTFHRFGPVNFSVFFLCVQLVPWLGVGRNDGGHRDIRPVGTRHGSGGAEQPGKVENFQQTRRW